MPRDKIVNAYVNCVSHGLECELLQDLTAKWKDGIQKFHNISKCSPGSCEILTNYLQKHPDLKEGFHFYRRHGASHKCFKKLFYKSNDSNIDHDLKIDVIKAHKLLL